MTDNSRAFAARSARGGRGTATYGAVSCRQIRRNRCSSRAIRIGIRLRHTDVVPVVSINGCGRRVFNATNGRCTSTGTRLRHRSEVPMRLAALLVCIIVYPSLALAQGKIDMRWDRNGIVRVSQGRNVRRIDLSRDIAGCVDRVFDSSNNERYGSGLHKTQVLDVTSRDGEHFLLLSAVAAPNCNVQGQCGAGDDNVTLIWVHVGADLAVANKQSFVLRDCVSARSVDGLPDDWPSNLKLTAGSLKLSFSETTYGADKVEELSGQVVYDRQSASEGIRITRSPK